MRTLNEESILPLTAVSRVSSLRLSADRWTLDRPKTDSGAPRPQTLRRRAGYPTVNARHRRAHPLTVLGPQRSQGNGLNSCCWEFNMSLFPCLSSPRSRHAGPVREARLAAVRPHIVEVRM